MSPSPEAEPQTEKIRARDVPTNRFGIWCTLADGPPHANPIVSVRWSDDGNRIWFMLDSHNFSDHDPDEILELVPLSDFWRSMKSEKIGPKPPPRHVLDDATHLPVHAYDSRRVCCAFDADAPVHDTTRMRTR